MKIHLWAPLLLFSLFATPAQSKVFKNSYIQFELPNQWGCNLQDTAWICRYQQPVQCIKKPKSKDCLESAQKTKEAVIILSAREVGTIDTLDNYLNNLKEPRIFKKNGIQSTQSQVIHAKSVQVAQDNWIDGMHLGSELPHYYTRYLATVKGHIAILVTFSSHKTHYTKYSSLFFNSIKSLKVIGTQIDKINRKELGPRVLSHPLDIPDELFNTEQNLLNESDDSSSQLLFAFAILLAVLGIFIWIKSKNKSNRKVRRRHH